MKREKAERRPVTFPMFAFGREIRIAREGQNLTLREVGERADMRIQTVHNAELGQAYLRNAMCVAKAVGIPARAAVRALQEDLMEMARLVGLD